MVSAPAEPRFDRPDRIFGKDRARDAADRARSLTSQLLTLAKSGAPVRKAASIRDLIRDSVSFSLRGSAVRCEFELDEDLSPVDIDGGQISQVINIRPRRD